MQAIAAELPPSDGVACFNRMYLDVTLQVNAELDNGFYADRAFMTELDVNFANLYFDAVNKGDDVKAVPRAWQPLFERRADPNIEEIQFALAGMNAHINHDLPVAVVTACAGLSTAPADGSHYADFQKVDQLLDTAEQSVRQSFESGPELAVDHHLQAVDNLVACWSINSARDVAWRNSLVLWTLRPDPAASALFLDGLAAATALASRLLLTAV